MRILGTTFHAYALEDMLLQERPWQIMKWTPLHGADGVIDLRGRHLLELEDVAQHYHRPSIIDIKLGHQTWYPGAEEGYIQRCQAKDAATTQAALGFKICGMQVRSRSALCTVL